MEALERAYIAAIVNAGAVPFVIPVLDPADAEAATSCLDGLLLTGGGDVDPAWYCRMPSPHLHEVDVWRDAWEFALIEAAVVRGIPMLGICRGCQILNVAFGGTLVQHLPEVTTLRHCDRQRAGKAVHSVAVEGGSLLRQIVGGDGLGVNSLHHQAVADVGKGLAVVGRAEDGTVEAVEGTGDIRAVGVQWHPELLTHESGHAELFQWLVTSASVGAPLV